jgi:hypothetical protein
MTCFALLQIPMVIIFKETAMLCAGILNITNFRQRLFIAPIYDNICQQAIPH